MNTAGEGTVTVCAHGDPDTVGAAMACAELFRALGRDVELVADGPLDDAALCALESFGLEAPKTLDALEAEEAAADPASVCAASTMVYLNYRDCEVPIPRDAARLLLAGILYATENLSAGTADMDRLAFRELVKLAEIEDTDALWQKMTEPVETSAAA